MENKKRCLCSIYKDICERYVNEFCKKHEYDSPERFWVGDDVGDILVVNDMFINFNDIRYDIDNNIEKHEFEKWYWKSLDVYEITGEKYLNYESFCKGAPDKYDEESLNRIKELKFKLNKEIKKFKNDIKI